ncbi:hypothetical protein LPW11_09920 [Geomonas sp. RF6]|uniref:hypothetical protein n=1 Tax=Geomonas sp. RF6 TaxID=2897342 RepID=UPI001E28C2D2|nr:hypothetical protein [Geomonas sp. RF6]UFS72491.1 hypothetical protein LPW11_09920 [Geomonas sp. RF6]
MGEVFMPSPTKGTGSKKAAEGRFRDAFERLKRNSPAGLLTSEWGTGFFSALQDCN